MLTQRRVFALLAVLFTIVTVCSFGLFYTSVLQAENSPTGSGIDLYPVIGLAMSTASVLVTIVFWMAVLRATSPRKDT